MKKILSLTLSILLLTALGATANGWKGEKVKLYGEITAIDEKMHTVTIKAQNGLQETFQVDSGTKIEQDTWGRDKYIMFSQLKTGQRVKAKYYENPHHYMGHQVSNEKDMPANTKLKVLREIEVKSR